MPPNELTGLISAPFHRMEAGQAAAPTTAPTSINTRSTVGRTYFRSQSNSQNVRTRDIDYDLDSHLTVLFQMHGSVWPKVLPWCLITMAFTYAIIELRDHDIVNLSINSNTGHGFMSILVSFLVVTRATITYNRFMEARQGVADLFRTSREVVQYACLLSLTNKGDSAKKWRQDVAYRTIICIRMAAAAVEFRAYGVSAWETLEDDNDDATDQLLLSASAGIPSSPQERKNFMAEMAHGPRTIADENFRAPVVWAYNLREKLLDPRGNAAILPKRPLHVNEDLKLLALVGEFVAAYDELKKLITTPFPFPLVQMTRTFLFFWVFSLPLVFAADNDRTSEVLVLMFFCTYGFLGLEFVNMELDDPYGTDPNDFPLRYVLAISDLLGGVFVVCPC
jgi:predicted membrane chloride channel (bestrophin family)